MSKSIIGVRVHHRKLSYVFKVDTEVECAHCGTTETPLWRRGSFGTALCNACGLRNKQSSSSKSRHKKSVPAKRQKQEPLVRKADLERHKLAADAPQPVREFTMEAWDEKNLAQVFDKIAQLLYPLVIALRCNGKTVLLDFVYTELIDINPDSNSPAMYKILEEYGVRGFNCRGIEIVPEVLATLKVDSLVPDLSAKLASVRLQLENRFTKVSLKVNYPLPPTQIVSALHQQALGSIMGKLNCDGGNFSRKEFEPVLMRDYPQIQQDIKAKLVGSPTELMFLPEIKLRAILDLFDMDASSKAMMHALFTTFRNCFQIAQTAPTILVSLSAEQDLLGMFKDPPDTCTWESFAKLQTLSRLLELKHVF